MTEENEETSRDSSDQTWLHNGYISAVMCFLQSASTPREKRWDVPLAVHHRTSCIVTCVRGRYSNRRLSEDVRSPQESAAIDGRSGVVDEPRWDGIEMVIISGHIQCLSIQTSVTSHGNWQCGLDDGD